MNVMDAIDLQYDYADKRHKLVKFKKGVKWAESKSRSKTNYSASGSERATPGRASAAAKDITKMTHTKGWRYMARTLRAVEKNQRGLSP